MREKQNFKNFQKNKLKNFELGIDFCFSVPVTRQFLAIVGLTSKLPHSEPGWTPPPEPPPPEATQLPSLPFQLPFLHLIFVVPDALVPAGQTSEH